MTVELFNAAHHALWWRNDDLLLPIRSSLCSLICHEKNDSRREIHQRFSIEVKVVPHIHRLSGIVHSRPG